MGNPFKALESASESTVGKLGKGAASFLFGPSAFLTGAICGAFGKIAAEGMNALMSSWIKSVSSGVSILFANNPFLTWASSASSNLAESAFNSFTYFYRESLISLSAHFTEFSNNAGVGTTGPSGVLNDLRDSEAEAQGKGKNPKTTKRLEEDTAAFFKMLAGFNQNDESEIARAVSEMQKWANRARDLPGNLVGSEDEKKKGAEKFVADFQAAIDKDPTLGALIDILNESERMAMEEVREKLKDKKDVTPEDISAAIIGAYKDLAKRIPDQRVKDPSGQELGPKAPIKQP